MDNPDSLDFRRTHNVHIVHININGLFGRRTELIHYLNECEPHFVTVNETKLREQTKMRIPNYHIIRRDRATNGGGVAILIRKDVKFNEIDTSEFNEEFLAISFESQRKKIGLATIYNPPGHSPNIENFKYIKNKFPLAIFMGDFNCKHAYFGCKKANKEGDILFNIIEELDLYITNDDTPTHRPNTTIGDLLDLAIVSREMAPKIESCDVGLDIGSDHLPVHLMLSSPEIQKQTQRQILQYEKTDWTRFSKYIKDKLKMTEAVTPSEIDEDCEILTKTIKTALDKSCPKSKPKDKAFYMSDNTMKLIKLKRQIRRLAQKTQNPTTKTLYNQLNNLVKKSIKKDKEAWWQKTTNKLDETKNCKIFWQTFNQISGKKSKSGASKPVFQENGKLTENNKEKANAFAKSLGKIHNTHEGAIFDDNFKREVEADIAENPLLFSPQIENIEELGDENPMMGDISIEEIKIQLGKTKGRSAPGADGIRYPVIKKCPEIVFDYLKHIYNACLNIGYFPSKWKEALGTMIPKPGKDQKITTNFRPISLLSCIGKLFEKIIANRMKTHLEEQEFFNLWQLGYRNKKCAIEHILRITDDAQTAFTTGHIGAAVFIDVEKAFDSVWHDGLKHKLMNSDLPRKIVRLMSSFITNRAINVNINNEISDRIELRAGTPQGSVLSPLLFLIYVNDVPVNPLNNNTKISQFADDLGFWTFGKNEKYLELRLSKALSELEAWCSKWRIKLNAKKTQLIIFKQRKKTRPLKLKLFGEDLVEAKEAKLLGVILNNSLDFKNHIEESVKKVEGD